MNEIPTPLLNAIANGGTLPLSREPVGHPGPKPPRVVWVRTADGWKPA